MAFELSFTDEFFWGEDGHWEEKSDTPTSVMQALFSLPRKDWDEMCREVFNCEPRFVDCHMVLSKVRETDSCSDLRSPVEVWIDREGHYTVLVYDREES